MLPERTAFRKSRVDQVGSLLRPPLLIESFLRAGRREISEAELQAAQDSAIRDVVAKQERVGLPCVTDGEFRRLNWQVSFSEVSGWDLWETSWRGFLRNPDNLSADEKPFHKGEDAVVSFKTPATSRLKLVSSFPAKEYAFLRKVTDRPIKITLMGPDRVCQMCDLDESREVYADPDEFLADVVAIQKEMVTQLVKSGCDYVQLDEPSFTGYVDPATLERMRLRGEDPLRSLKRAIAADNQVIEGLQGQAVFGLHICRGNRASMWHREGAYDDIAELLFGGLKFDRLLLEYDSDRAGGFEPLRFVPKGTIAVLGLITTKRGRVETVDELRRRLDDAGRFISLDQVAISPQCGFASGIAGNVLTEDEQWRKLEVMLETTRRVWG